MLVSMIRKSPTIIFSEHILRTTVSNIITNVNVNPFGYLWKPTSYGQMEVACILNSVSNQNLFCFMRFDR